MSNQYRRPEASFKARFSARVRCFPARYSIDRNTDLERFFNIDALSGVISTAKPLDREVNSVHNLTILAIETRESRRDPANPVSTLQQVAVAAVGDWGNFFVTQTHNQGRKKLY